MSAERIPAAIAQIEAIDTLKDVRSARPGTVLAGRIVTGLDRYAR
jgi:hypothetical protein